jgi:hypothetical protein
MNSVTNCNSFEHKLPLRSNLRYPLSANLQTWTKRGEGATFGGYAVAVYQSWYLIYKPMNDMNFAPSYINNDGEPPVYGDPTKDPY